MTNNIILEVSRLKQLCFEEVVRSELTGIHKNSPEHVRSNPSTERRYAFFADHPKKRIKAILIIEPLLGGFSEVSLKADHHDFGWIPDEPGYSSRHTTSTR